MSSKRALIFCAILTAVNAGIGAAYARDGAVIRNSGSTNTRGYTIALWSDGTARVNDSARTIPLPVVRSFFSDVRAARNANVSGVPCMKSASFGYSLRVSWHGWISPDLACPVRSRLGQALAADIGEIAGYADVGPPHMRRLLPNEPRMPVTSPPAPSPTPAPSS